MPTKPNKQADRSRRTKRQITAAATELFAQHGFDAVSMRRIAAAAGSDIALVLYHFKSKDALYQAVVTEILANFTRKRDSLLTKLLRRNSSPSSLELFDTLLEPWLDLLFSRHRNHAWLLIRNMSDTPEGDHSFSVVYSDPSIKKFLSLLLESSRETPPELLHGAYHIYSALIIYLISSGGRMERLSGNLLHIGDRNGVRRHILGLLANSLHLPDDAVSRICDPRDDLTEAA